MHLPLVYMGWFWFSCGCCGGVSLVVVVGMSAGVGVGVGAGVGQGLGASVGVVAGVGLLVLG